MKKLIILLLLFFYGCGIFIPASKSVEKLSKIQIKMTQKDVKTKIGEPDEVRGSVINEEGNTVTVWQYELYNKDAGLKNFVLGFLVLTISWWVPGGSNDYWLYFVENQLAQWGRAGDWREDLIMKIKLETKTN